MDAIPAEIILAIVRGVDEKDLHALTLVNRHFYTVANPLLWQSVDIHSKPKCIQLLQAMQLSKGDLFQHIRSLTFSTLITDALLLMHVQQLPPSFQELDMSYAEHITHEGLQHLPRQCPQLTSLGLGYASIIDPSLVLLGEHCSQLEHIYFSNCEALSPNLFAALAGCPLETIHILGKPIAGDVEARKMAMDLVKFSSVDKTLLAGGRYGFHLSPVGHLGSGRELSLATLDGI
ncbi:unnamed protein product [Absidia cylindrospora]